MRIHELHMEFRLSDLKKALICFTPIAASRHLELGHVPSPLICVNRWNKSNLKNFNWKHLDQKCVTLADYHFNSI